MSPYIIQVLFMCFDSGDLLSPNPTSVQQLCKALHLKKKWKEFEW